MLERERRLLILKLVEERSVVSIADLVETLGSSEATVRRAVNALAEEGRLRRVHGGAESLRPRHDTHLAGMPFEMSRGVASAQKRAIAREAAKLIAPGESLIIGAGSTTHAMAEFLGGDGLTVLTNSLPLASQLIGESRHRVVLPAGTVYREQRIVLSPYEDDGIGHFWARKFFTSCYGLNGFGVMETDPLVVQAHIRLLRRAEKLIVLADSRKFALRSPMIVAGLERVATLVTDSGASDAQLQVFRDAGIEVILAQPEPTDLAFAAQG